MPIRMPWSAIGNRQQVIAAYDRSNAPSILKLKSDQRTARFLGISWLDKHARKGRCLDTGSARLQCQRTKWQLLSAPARERTVRCRPHPCRYAECQAQPFES